MFYRILLLAIRIVSCFPQGEEARIVNGQTAPLNSYPWITYLSLNRDGGFCGGVILDQNTLITAGHCSAKVNLETARVYYNKDSQNQAITFMVQSVTVHPFFDPKTFANDIAVWKIKQISKGVLPPNPVVLDIGARSWTGMNLQVGGWGSLEFKGANSDRLIEASLPVADDQVCRNTFPWFPSSSFCAGFVNGGADACEGDSGGPLFSIEGNSMIVVGLVSNGSGCGRTLGLYTKISAVSDFIDAARNGRQFRGSVSASINQNALPISSNPTQQQLNSGGSALSKNLLYLAMLLI